MQSLEISRLFNESMLWFAADNDGTRLARDERKQHRLFSALERDGEIGAAGPDISNDSLARFGIPEIDSELAAGGLKYGAVHELFFSSTRDSYYPLLLPAGLIAGSSSARGGYVFWIGKKIWPTPFMLEEAGGAEFISRCVFLDPPDDKALFWAVETALRSKAVTGVVAAVKNLRFATSRRFELAARAGSAIGFILRSESGLKDNSAAATRWLIRHSPSQELDPLFEIELLKQKGAGAASLRWTIGFHTDEDGKKKVSLHIPSGLGGESEAEYLRKCAG